MQRITSTPQVRYRYKRRPSPLQKYGFIPKFVAILLASVTLFAAAAIAGFILL